MTEQHVAVTITLSTEVLRVLHALTQRRELPSRMKLKLKHVEGDGEEFGVVENYVCVACGRLCSFEQLAFMRVTDLLARYVRDVPGGECPNEDCPQTITSPQGPAALCFSAEDGLWEDTHTDWDLVFE